MDSQDSRLPDVALDALSEQAWALAAEQVEEIIRLADDCSPEVSPSDLRKLRVTTGLVVGEVWRRRRVAKAERAVIYGRKAKKGR